MSDQICLSQFFVILGISTSLSVDGLKLIKGSK